MNMMFLSVKYGRLQKYDSSRKRSDNAQIIFSFSFILFYHFRFCLFDNYFHFDLALKVDKILKTILENRKLPFSFSSLSPSFRSSISFAITCAAISTPA